MKTREWRECCAVGEHQGLVIDARDGRAVAVTYDRMDAPLVAAAPALLETLRNIHEAHFQGALAAKAMELGDAREYAAALVAELEKLPALIAKTEGRS